MYLDGDGPGNDVPGGEVLGVGRVPLHEEVPLGVDESAALAPAALRHEHATSVNSCESASRTRHYIAL